MPHDAVDRINAEHPCCVTLLVNVWGDFGPTRDAGAGPAHVRAIGGTQAGARRVLCGNPAVLQG
jgi:hypothetical protein